MKINHESPIPYYIQLKEALEARIADGEWKPGTASSEQDLCASTR